MERTTGWASTSRPLAKAKPREAVHFWTCPWIREHRHGTGFNDLGLRARSISSPAQVRRDPPRLENVALELHRNVRVLCLFPLDLQPKEHASKEKEHCTKAPDKNLRDPGLFQS